MPVPRPDRYTYMAPPATFVFGNAEGCVPITRVGMSANVLSISQTFRRQACTASRPMVVARRSRRPRASGGGGDLLRCLLMIEPLRLCVQNGDGATLLPQIGGDQAGPDRRLDRGRSRGSIPDRPGPGLVVSRARRQAGLDTAASLVFVQRPVRDPSRTSSSCPHTASQSERKMCRRSNVPASPPHVLLPGDAGQKVMSSRPVPVMSTNR